MLSPGLHLFVVQILPQIVAFLCTAFVLYAGRYVKAAEYFGVITRGENKWKEDLNTAKVIDLHDKTKRGSDRIRKLSEHITYELDEADPDRQFH